MFNTRLIKLAIFAPAVTALLLSGVLMLACAAWAVIEAVPGGLHAGLAAEQAARSAIEDESPMDMPGWYEKAAAAGERFEPIRDLPESDIERVEIETAVPKTQNTSYVIIRGYW